MMVKGFLFRKDISQSETTAIFAKAADITEQHYNARNSDVSLDPHIPHRSGSGDVWHFRLTEMQIINDPARSLALWTQTSLHAVLKTVFSGISASLNLLRVVRKF